MAKITKIVVKAAPPVVFEVTDDTGEVEEIPITISELWGSNINLEFEEGDVIDVNETDAADLERFFGQTPEDEADTTEESSELTENEDDGDKPF
jgi:hypothetical protein